MTETEELAWLRNWRTRILSAMRLWFGPGTYKQACERWSAVVSILKETPEEAE
jgi:hypothetical protein